MEKVSYPDGTPVKKGDIIWVNEGLHVRKVVRILTNEDDLESEDMDEPSIFWARYIGPLDMGSLGFHGISHFVEDGVSKLYQTELLCIKMLYTQLGRQIQEQIWEKDYFYYPILHPQEIGHHTYKWVWYLFFQKFQEKIDSFDHEKCFRFDEERMMFEPVTQKEQNLVRGFM